MKSSVYSVAGGSQLTCSAPAAPAQVAVIFTGGATSPGRKVPKLTASAAGSGALPQLQGQASSMQQQQPPPVRNPPVRLGMAPRHYCNNNCVTPGMGVVWAQGLAVPGHAVTCMKSWVLLAASALGLEQGQAVLELAARLPLHYGGG